MTQKVRKRLESLQESTAKYSSTVQRKLSTGDRRESALVHSAAKYYVALKKLAEK